MNLNYQPLRELIEYASNNRHDVSVRSNYCCIDFLDDSGCVTFFDSSDGICIIRIKYRSNNNPVRLSVDDFKSIFSIKS